jgi:hypothetical protein
LARLQSREHEPDAALDYEITRELIGQVLALYSARRAELERTDPVDHRALDATISQQGDFAELLQSLDPAETERVARVGRSAPTSCGGLTRAANDGFPPRSTFRRRQRATAPGGKHPDWPPRCKAERDRPWSKTEQRWYTRSSGKLRASINLGTTRSSTPSTPVVSVEVV